MKYLISLSAKYAFLHYIASMRKTETVSDRLKTKNIRHMFI